MLQLQIADNESSSLYGQRILLRSAYVGEIAIDLHIQLSLQMNQRMNWIWFRVAFNDGSRWVSGWYGMPFVLGGVRIENVDDVTYRVPEWRVAWEEPNDLKLLPFIGARLLSTAPVQAYGFKTVDEMTDTAALRH